MLKRVILAALILVFGAPVFSSVSVAQDAVETETLNPRKPARSGEVSDDGSAREVEGDSGSSDGSGLYQPDLESYEVPELDLSKRLTVTLDEALRLAVEESYQARVSRSTFARSQFSVQIARAPFDPTLSSSLGYTSVERGGQSSLTFANYVSRSKSTFFNLDLRSRFPTGQDFSFTHSLSRSEVSIAGTEGTQIPRSYSGELRFSLTQPLGRGSGIAANKWGLWQAENAFSLAEFNLTDSERNLRYQTFLQYYQLVAQRKALAARRLNLTAAIKLLERNFERYKVGLAIRADVLQAENNVLNQKSRMMEAQRAYLDALDSLALLLGVSQPLDIDPDVELIPPPLPLHMERDWPSVRKVSAKVRQLETDLRNLEIERGFRVSELRPDVNLALSYTRQGEDATAGSTLRNLDNQSYSLSLNYSLPWGKRASKSRLAQVEQDLDIARARLEEANQELHQQWEGLFRELESKRAQVTLSESSVRVAEENYQIQVERNKVGLASTLDVIQAQESLLEAQLALLNAQVAYQSTYRELLLLSGTI